MLTPVVKNPEDLGIRRNLSGRIDGPIDTADKALIESKINQIAADERDLADTYVALDNSPQDLDPRPGFVSITRNTHLNGTQDMNSADRDRTESVSVQFDPASRQPLKMTRVVSTDAYYPFQDQRQHIEGRATVAWSAAGTLTDVDESRTLDVLSPKMYYYNSVSLHRVDTVITYQEHYADGMGSRPQDLPPTR